MNRALGQATRLYLAVGSGSAIGGAARWGVYEAVGAAGIEMLWATWVVNVTGSFLITFFATLSDPDGRLFVGPAVRQLVMTGVCGGYTTFSVFSLDTVRMLEAGRLGAASANVIFSLLSWLLAAAAGSMLAARLNRLRR